MSGIRTLDDLKQRCHVERETGCWLWRGATTDGIPTMWIPELGRTTTIGGALSWLVDRKVDRLVLWRSKCEVTTCCNRHHRERTTRGALMASLGLKRTPAELVRMRQASIRYPQALVDAILADEGTGRAVAKRHGVNESYVSRLRNGKIIRRPAGSPFEQLMPRGSR